MNRTPGNEDSGHDPVASVEGGAADESYLGDPESARGKLDSVEVERFVQQQREREGSRRAESRAVMLGRPEPFSSVRDLLHTPYAPAARPWTGSPELVVAADPMGPEAEIFRDLRSQILAKALARRTRAAVAVISPRRGEGRSYVAANLAASLAQLGGRTLLIDADLRGPRLHRLFGTPEHGGLSAMLAGHTQPMPAADLTALPGLFFLSAGAVPRNAVDLLQGPRFSLLLYEMLSQFDHVVVDTPADACGADARLIAAKAGTALLVGRLGSTPMNAMRQLLARLNNGPADVAGIVLNSH